MERTVEVWRVAVFADTASGGNPAGVVADAAGLSDDAMQAVARHTGDSETAFVLPARDATHDVYVRFFTPRCEVPVCGHATLGAHAVRAVIAADASGRVRQRSPGALWTITWSRPHGGAGPHVTMVQEPVTWGEEIDAAAAGALHAALGSEPPGDGPPPRIVSTGHAKVVVPVGSIAALRQLAPDMAALRAVADRVGVPGFFLFARTEAGDEACTECRMFAPSLGIDEDPVNGSGHGPLAVYLDRYGLLQGDSFVSRMGIAARRPGRVHVSVERAHGQIVRVHVGGDVSVIERLAVGVPGDGARRVDR